MATKSPSVAYVAFFLLSSGYDRDELGDRPADAAVGWQRDSRLRQSDGRTDGHVGLAKTDGRTDGTGIYVFVRQALCMRHGATSRGSKEAGS